MSAEMLPSVAPQQGQSRALAIAEIMQYAKCFVDSGMFTDIRSQAQAMVKIQAGGEMGLPPFQAMKCLHIIKGNVVMAGHTIAGKVKSHPRYDYVIEQATATVCKGVFIDRVTGVKNVHEYTMDDAKRAGDAGKDNYKKYPAAMLFNRWISSGQKMYAPDATNGVLVYTPDELDGKINEQGEYVEVAAEVIEPVKQAIVIEQAPADPMEERQNRVNVRIARAEAKGIDELVARSGWQQVVGECGFTNTSEFSDAEFETAITRYTDWLKGLIAELDAGVAANADNQ